MPLGPGEETLVWLAGAMLLLALTGHLDGAGALFALALAWPAAKLLGVYGDA